MAPRWKRDASVCGVTRSHTLCSQEIVPLFTAWGYVPGQGKIAIFRLFQLFQDEMQDYEWVKKVGMVFVKLTCNLLRPIRTSCFHHKSYQDFFKPWRCSGVDGSNRYSVFINKHVFLITLQTMLKHAHTDRKQNKPVCLLLKGGNSCFAVQYNLYPYFLSS